MYYIKYGGNFYEFKYATFLNKNKTYNITHPTYLEFFIRIKLTSNIDNVKINEYQRIASLFNAGIKTNAINPAVIIDTSYKELYFSKKK